MSRESIGIIGGNSFVGSEVGKLLANKGIDVIPTNSFHVNITDRNSVDRWMSQVKTDSVVLAAAYTDVNKAEVESASAELINIVGAVNVAVSAKRYGKHLMYLSTGHVFDGTEDAPGPYHETDKTILNSGKKGVYAETKLVAERFILDTNCNAAIVRIDFPFGNLESPKDFLGKTIKRIESDGAFYSDQVITPTYIPDLARAIREISERKLNGIFHVTCRDSTTPYEIANHIVTIKGLGRVNASKFEQTGGVMRPKYGGLRNADTYKTIGGAPSNWWDAIEEVLGIKIEFS